MSASEKGCENVTDLRVVRPAMSLFQWDLLEFGWLTDAASKTYWART